jgi:hypothetical protein
VQDSTVGTSFVRNSKKGYELKKNKYYTYSENEWVLETQLHKRRLKKDIDNTPHL